MAARRAREEELRLPRLLSLPLLLLPATTRTTRPLLSWRSSFIGGGGGAKGAETGREKENKKKQVEKNDCKPNQKSVFLFSLLRFRALARVLLVASDESSRLSTSVEL